MTKEHLGLALALSVPVFVVVTKIDMCPANKLQETLKVTSSFDFSFDSSPQEEFLFSLMIFPNEDLSEFMWTLL